MVLDAFVCVKLSLGCNGRCAEGLTLGRLPEYPSGIKDELKMSKFPVVSYCRRKGEKSALTTGRSGLKLHLSLQSEV